MAEPEQDLTTENEEEIEYEEKEEEINQTQEVEEQEEEEEEGETKPVKKRRCVRKKKIRQICFEDEDTEGGEGGEGLSSNVEAEEDEDEEGGEEEEEEDEISTGSSVMSAVSFVWENEVYEFEELCDPGNIKTIYRKFRLEAEPDLYDESGVQRYLEVCLGLNIAPTIHVLRSLHTKELDISYRNLHTSSIKAMCAALESNHIVERLILRYNNLKVDDCNYIGLMLRNNETLTYLDFTGCRMGPEGISLLTSFLSKTETVSYLNLSKCNIQDEGMRLLSSALIRNNSIQQLDLSYNKLGDGGAEMLGFAFKMNSSISDLNLRYNNLFEPNAMKGFFRSLSFNNTISRLDLSWNGLNGSEMGGLIGNFLKKCRNLNYLDLSDNRFEGMAVVELKKGLARCSRLETFKIGKNPMSPEDMDVILAGAKGCTTLLVLDLEDLWVKKSFIKSLKKIQLDRDIQVNFAGVYSNYEVFGPDYPKVILLRAQFEAMKPKSAKKRKDFGHLIWTLGDEPMTQDEFMTRVKKFKAKISKELFPELMKQFTNPKLQLIDVVAMRKKYLSIFPDSQPPPPPKVKGKKEEAEPESEGVEVKTEEKGETVVAQVDTEGEKILPEGGDGEFELAIKEENAVEEDGLILDALEENIENEVEEGKEDEGG